jgi:hypothetical protein
MTLANGPAWVTGKIGGALSANGVNQYGSVPSIDLSGTNAVTLTLWTNRTYSTASPHVLVEASTNYNNSATGFMLLPDDSLCSGMEVAVHGNAGYSVNCYSQPTSGVWHHLAAVFDKSQAGAKQTALYIDGILQTPTRNMNTSANTNNFGNNPIYLFSRAGTQYFTAAMVDDLRLYNRALSAAEIQQIYNYTGASLVSVAVTPGNPSVAKGLTVAFTATGTYSDNSTQNLTGTVTWSSSNPAAATITTGGVATGAGVGTSTIQAALGAVSGSTVLTVTAPQLVSLGVTPANASVAVNSSQNYTATGTYTDGSVQNLTGSVTWSSSNTGVATITAAGAATGVAAGSTTIQASLGFINGSTGMTVTGSITGLVAQWKFDEGAGSVAADSSGSGHTMTLANGPAWVTGKIGGALSANGVNQYGSVPSIDLSGTNAVTLTLWTNRMYSTASPHVLVEASTNYNNSATGFMLLPDDNLCSGMEVAVHGNAGYSVNCYSQPTSGVWHHLAAVFDKSQAGANQTALYIDGVLQTPTRNLNTSTNTNNFGNNPIYLFSRAGTQYFTGAMVDDLRLYNRALSAAEIQQIAAGVQ